MTWDLASPRACKPSAELENAAYVVRGGPLHALHSPLPYGLGVYSVDSTGTRKALPLYYVSEKVARARGRGVKEGWYVVAVPGVEFELAVTAVQQNFPRIQDEPLKDGYDTRARLIVDGMHVRSYKSKFCSSNVPFRV